jgi:hypothetical protein
MAVDRIDLTIASLVVVPLMSPPHDSINLMAALPGPVSIPSPLLPTSEVDTLEKLILRIDKRKATEIDQ